MNDRLRFFLNRVGERLWVKPMIICALSIGAVFLAKMADDFDIFYLVPDISRESIESLLTIMSSSMLVIAVFAVGSMLSAYDSAAGAATPRSFALVVADDVSQNALSTFVGAFIFSIVAIIALLNGYYEQAGRFALFVLTIFVFTLVVISFLRWVDRIARLGRLSTTIGKVEEVTQDMLQRRRECPTLRATKAEGRHDGSAIYGNTIGYIQRIDIAALQAAAEQANIRIEVALLPGNFTLPGQALAFAQADQVSAENEIDVECIRAAFSIGKERTFDDDPRFGLIVLSEIASRALSPAVNDPGTAISIIGSLVRLFEAWAEQPADREQEDSIEFDRVAVPELSLQDMFDDAFNAVARDGAASIEVMIRLQKALGALATIDDREMKEAARARARIVLAHAERALVLPGELDILRSESGFTN